eukprot:NODE_1176_length_1620_cov_26.902210_g1107_i0.p1 GENE.NODE_1176_length_1620_cov_26.902210_g1107_i0~~NODE_1176_length_1620_cov_26.902210_g1107_i0.p1  ORF type:complete len:514 (-),score=131.50 NODE_1176_length_1620_cov_26.902210_g1107_i0:78-1454(-)
MVVHFRELGLDNPGQAGLWVGLLGTAFGLGQFFATPIWGRLSDRIGRRPILISGTSCCSIVLIVFGMAPTYLVALIARFVQGVFNGNVAVSRAYIADITTKTNRPAAMGILASAQGLGFLLGPLLGGVLVDPETQYGIKIDLFITYPYLPPCIVIAAFYLLAATTVFIALPSKRVMELESTPIMSKQGEAAASEPPSLLELLKRHHVFILCCLYFFHRWVAIMKVETISLWSASPTYYGGLGLSPSEIGTFLMSRSVAVIFFPTVFYPALQKKLGSSFLAYIVCALIFIPTILLEGLGTYTLEDYPYLSWPGLVLCEMANESMICGGYNALYMLVTTASDKKTIGAMNGLAQASGALAFAITPALAGAVYRYSSTSDNSWPFNYYACFLILGCLMLIGATLCKILSNMPEMDENKGEYGASEVPKKEEYSRRSSEEEMGLFQRPDCWDPDEDEETSKQ